MYSSEREVERLFLTNTTERLVTFETKILKYEYKYEKKLGRIETKVFICAFSRKLLEKELLTFIRKGKLFGIFVDKEDIYIYEIFVKIFLHKICEQMRAEALKIAFLSVLITSAKKS